MTPMIKATCCFQGVASTSCPVFRSCRLLFAIAATLKTTAVVNSANAINALTVSGPTYGLTPMTSNNAAPITTRIPMPESGLLEEPNNPRHITAHGRNKETHQHDVNNAADNERRQMRAETARVPKITEQPADR